ncbi:Mitochondrial carnitine/acylcarnitine carrier protein [Hypsibius exemplaris]|uniref:Mitochondrial carnitine/acylcarnitine carrier protein n=1 Tax=Hypsibius exemplaris TaxID=2072580 RepID=A0A1W0WRM5_HYPEX|nr:Mitochondrial carnitine/acylcarnitine carrier protein [Hypsibius exemplaris]
MRHCSAGIFSHHHDDDILSVHLTYLQPRFLMDAPELVVEITDSLGSTNNRNISPLNDFLAGGIAGACLIVVGHPLDTIKVRLQTSSGYGSLPVYSGTYDCFKKTVKAEGVRGLYKGMALPFLAVTPILAVSFWSFNVGKALQRDEPNQNLSAFQLFQAGCLAGLLTTPITGPGERIKCLLQVQRGGAMTKYSGPVDVARQLYRAGGLRSIFRGTLITFVRGIPSNGIYFMTYEWLRKATTPTGEDPTGMVTALRAIFAGGMAGLTNGVVALPPDAIKSRLQTTHDGDYPNGARDVFREIRREHGLRGFYRGLAPVMMRAFPANAACFLGYEFALYALEFGKVSATYRSSKQ